MVGDGQVTLGEQVIMKQTRKVRRLYEGKVLVDFGSVVMPSLCSKSLKQNYNNLVVIWNVH